MAQLTGDLEAAAARYDAAANQLRAAARVVRELQAADADRLERRAGDLRARHVSLRALVDLADRETVLA